MMRFQATPSNAILLTLLSSAIAAGCGTESSDHTGTNDAASDSASLGSGGSATGGSSGAGAAGSGGFSNAGGAAGTIGAGATGAVGGVGGANSGGMGGNLADASTRGAAGTRGSGGFPSPRRPFLVGSTLRSARRAARLDWSAELGRVGDQLDPGTREALFDAWLQDALEEHASVAAFARLSLLLLSLGAPPDFVRDAQRASLDEIVHAKSCFGLANRYKEESCGPSALSLEQAFESMGLTELARLVAVEGCVGETLGAVLAREQLAVTRDHAVARVLSRICRDEMRHAAFSWRLAAWLIRTGGVEIRGIVLDASEQALAAMLSLPERSLGGVDLTGWHAHGRLSCVEAKAVTTRAITEVMRPSFRELVSRAA